MGFVMAIRIIGIRHFSVKGQGSGRNRRCEYFFRDTFFAMFAAPEKLRV